MGLFAFNLARQREAEKKKLLAESLKEEPKKELENKSSFVELKLKELQEIAKTKGLKGYSRLNKQKLIKMLEGV